MQKKEIAVFIDQITRERATGDLLIVGWAIAAVPNDLPPLPFSPSPFLSSSPPFVRFSLPPFSPLDVPPPRCFPVRLSGK
ncbi:glycosyltransferase family 2 protein, partial [Enterococcus faecium]|nr:glycosyltransferase family 2 protein [Enterococcus faecium]